jgi:hypothetical protein
MDSKKRRYDDDSLCSIPSPNFFFLNINLPYITINQKKQEKKQADKQTRKKKSLKKLMKNTKKIEKCSKKSSVTKEKNFHPN